MPASCILAVALPTPVRTTFDYRVPDPLPRDESRLADREAQTSSTAWIGCRVAVKLATRSMVGVVVAVKNSSDIGRERLRSIERRLDTLPLLSESLLELCRWAAEYYHHPLGEVISTALPAALRQGEDTDIHSAKAWKLTGKGAALDVSELRRSPRQQALIRELQLALEQGIESLFHSNLLQLGYTTAHLQRSARKGWLETLQCRPGRQTSGLLREAPLTLNDEQQAALNGVEPGRFQTLLLHGTTGSGKTEVYLQAIERVLERGLQALILIPEIGLTPQMLQRFQARFMRPLCALHSGLSHGERKQAWLEAAHGDTDIIIGTRSAIFTPLPRAGLIIIDEEHDLSFKQQKGLRYSARDLAVVRARQLGIPLLLGTATPALETLHNVSQHRYRLLRLTRRAGRAVPPAIELVDIKRQPLQGGFAAPSLEAIARTLNDGHQVLVFINRRGFAPTLICHDCGWIAQCRHCDARMTVHRQPAHLRCHHCDYQRAPAEHCPTCCSQNLQFLGQGTERAEEILESEFPDIPVLRVDRDSTSRKNALRDILDQVQQQRPCILVGTQMLAKGHHFPAVTLAIVLDADAGLFSTDFRGPERMGQLLVQVAGRSGRAERPGRVLIQTHLCDHPLLQTLLQQGYQSYAERLLRERELTGMPPFRHLALLRAESSRAENAVQFLRTARQLAQRIHPATPALHYLGPLPAPMERRKQRFRYQLQINAGRRASLHQLLDTLIPELDRHATARRTRWSIDIDPQDMT